MASGRKLELEELAELEANLELVAFLEEQAADILGTELEELCRQKWLLKLVLQICEEGTCPHCRSLKP